jgi:hypothetical protein
MSPHLLQFESTLERRTGFGGEAGRLAAALAPVDPGENNCRRALIRGHTVLFTTAGQSFGDLAVRMVRGFLGMRRARPRKDATIASERDEPT